MTITKKQYDAKTAITPAGWSYDWRHAVVWGDHRVTKSIPLDADHVLIATIGYRAEIVRERNPYGCIIPRETGRQVPTLNVKRWTQRPGERFATSSGLGASVAVGEPQDRKIYKALCKIAAEVTEEQIFDLLAPAVDAENKPVIGA